MIRSLFICSLKGDIIIEKHWGGHVSRSIIEQFFMEASKHATGDAPPIVSTPKFFIFHIQAGDLYFVCPVQGEVPPLYVFEFLQRVVAIFKEYFGEVNEESLKSNFVSVYELLEELMDGGIPFMTESNVLKEIVYPPSILSALGAASISTVLPEGVLTNIPWRKANVKYTANEIYFDITEEMDGIFDGNGMLVASTVHGTIECQSKMSGVPDLTLRLTNPRMLDDWSFHPCVRYARFEHERVVSFVPPDGSFRLMTYRINQQIQAPLYCKPQISFGDTGGKVNVMVGTKNCGGKTVENVVVHIPFGPSICSVNLSPTLGTVSFDDISKVCKWDIGKIPKDKAPLLTGNISLSPGAVAPESGPTVTVEFHVEMFAVSGIKVDTLTLHNETYKHFKGVRSVTKAGRFICRS